MHNAIFNAMFTNYLSTISANSGFIVLAAMFLIPALVCVSMYVGVRIIALVRQRAMLDTVNATQGNVESVFPNINKVFPIKDVEFGILSSEHPCTTQREYRNAVLFLSK